MSSHNRNNRLPRRSSARHLLQAQHNASNRSLFAALDDATVATQFKPADPNRWATQKIKFSGKVAGKIKKETIKGKLIKGGISHFKNNPGTYIAMMYHISDLKKPKQEQEFSYFHRKGTANNYYPMDVAPDGEFQMHINNYYVLPPCKDNILPKKYRDMYTDSMSFEGKKLHTKTNPPLMPGRGMGFVDVPTLRVLGDVDPGDVAQGIGGIGDCWLLSAISTLAEYDGAVRRLFRKTKDFDEMPFMNKPNFYTVTLWDLNTWEEVDIVIDERLCSRPNSAKLYGNQRLLGALPSNGNDLWVPYLEKAVAIHCGGWDALHYGGNCAHGWALLTGVRDQCIILRKGDESTGWLCYNKYDQYNKVWAEQHNNPWKDPQSVWEVPWPEPGGGGSGEQTDTELFLRMCAYTDSNYLLACSSKGTSDSEVVDGIVHAHAYGIADCLSNVAGTGLNLIQLRNPWGRGEAERCQFLRGKGVGWKMYPQIKKELNPELDDPGVFWLTQEEFFYYFDKVFVSAEGMERFLGLKKKEPDRFSKESEEKKEDNTERDTRKRKGDDEADSDSNSLTAEDLLFTPTQVKKSRRARLERVQEFKGNDELDVRKLNGDEKSDLNNTLFTPKIKNKKASDIQQKSETETGKRNSDENDNADSAIDDVLFTPKAKNNKSEKTAETKEKVQEKSDKDTKKRKSEQKPNQSKSLPNGGWVNPFKKAVTEPQKSKEKNAPKKNSVPPQKEQQPKALRSTPNHALLSPILEGVSPDAKKQAYGAKLTSQGNDLQQAEKKILELQENLESQRRENKSNDDRVTALSNELTKARQTISSLEKAKEDLGDGQHAKLSPSNQGENLDQALATIQELEDKLRKADIMQKQQQDSQEKQVDSKDKTKRRLEKLETQIKESEEALQEKGKELDAKAVQLEEANGRIQELEKRALQQTSDEEKGLDSLGDPQLEKNLSKMNRDQEKKLKDMSKRLSSQKVELDQAKATIQDLEEKLKLSQPVQQDTQDAKQKKAGWFKTLLQPNQADDEKGELETSSSHQELQRDNQMAVDYEKKLIATKAKLSDKVSELKQAKVQIQGLEDKLKKSQGHGKSKVDPTETTEKDQQLEEANGKIRELEKRLANQSGAQKGTNMDVSDTQLLKEKLNKMTQDHEEKVRSMKERMKQKDADIEALEKALQRDLEESKNSKEKPNMPMDGDNDKSLSIEDLEKHTKQDFEALKWEVEKLKTTLESKQHRIDSQAEIIQENESLIQSLKAEAATNETDFTAELEKTKKESKDRQNHDSDPEYTQSANSKEKNLPESLKKKIKTLENSLASKQQALDIQSEEIDEKDAKIKSLESKLGKQKRTLGSSEIRENPTLGADLESELEETKEKLRQQNKESASDKKRVSRIQSDLDKEIDKSKSLKKNVRYLENLVESQNKTIDSQTKELGRNGDSIQTLKTKIREEKAKSKAISKNDRHASKLVADLAAKLEETRQRLRDQMALNKLSGTTPETTRTPEFSSQQRTKQATVDNERAKVDNWESLVKQKRNSLDSGPEDQYVPPTLTGRTRMAEVENSKYPFEGFRQTFGSRIREEDEHDRSFEDTINDYLDGLTERVLKTKGQLEIAQKRLHTAVGRNLAN